MFYSLTNTQTSTIELVQCHLCLCIYFLLLRNKQLLPPQLKCVNNFRLHCSLKRISTRRISYRFKEVHYGREDDLKHISDNFKNVARASMMFMCNRIKRVCKIHNWNRMQKSNTANKIYRVLNTYKLTILTKTQHTSGK